MISPGSVLVPGGSCWDPALALANFTHGLISTQHRCPIGTRPLLPWQCQLQGPRTCQLSKELNHRSHGCSSRYEQATLAQIENTVRHGEFSSNRCSLFLFFTSYGFLSFMFSCFENHVCYSEVGIDPKNKTLCTADGVQTALQSALTGA